MPCLVSVAVASLVHTLICGKNLIKFKTNLICLPFYICGPDDIAKLLILRGYSSLEWHYFNSQQLEGGRGKCHQELGDERKII